MRPRGSLCGEVLGDRAQGLQAGVARVIPPSGSLGFLSISASQHAHPWITHEVHAALTRPCFAESLHSGLWAGRTSWWSLGSEQEV